MSKTAKVLITGAVAAASVIGLAGSASANVTSALYRGQSLNIGDSIVGTTGTSTWFELTLQSDGNLVEYRWDGDPTSGPQSRKVCWAANTKGSGAHHATFQQDGNFVLYTSGGFAVWSSNTAGKAGSTVDISSNGSVYVGVTQKTSGC
ncbi:hypothetical protein ACFRMQ_07505 [Kitasatospora sp. NPDC056783]|uniref:hypothetical protein n=1 Tax=Kitasatospora sp. NPDC056783 TaxID=3345943 RepID=UPI00368A1565